MNPTAYLRGEGIAVAVIAVVGLYLVDAPLWLVLVLALAPDLGMLGYLWNPRIGALSYNLLHWYPLPLAVGGSGVFYGMEVATWCGLVWIAHIGTDRGLGYGLKHSDAFTHTHLGKDERDEVVGGLE